MDSNASPSISGPTPNGMRDNRYTKTTEYQIIKLIRKIFYLLGLATSAIVRLVIDVFKGLAGKS